jgi:hypothetical protein
MDQAGGAERGRPSGERWESGWGAIGPSPPTPSESSRARIDPALLLGLEDAGGAGEGDLIGDREFGG